MENDVYENAFTLLGLFDLTFAYGNRSIKATFFFVFSLSVGGNSRRSTVSVV